MRIIKRFCAMTAPVLLLLMLLLACGMGRAHAEPEVVHYRLDLSRPDSGKVGVTMEVETATQPLSLEMGDSYGNGLAVDLASHITNESALDSSGKALPLSRDGNTWQVDAAGLITLSYEVDLTGYKAGTEYLDSVAGSGMPWPYFPFLDAGLAYLPGYAVFIHPTGMGNLQPRVELILPPGWQQALPWIDQPGDLDDLLFNPLYAGELAIQEQGSLLLALPAASTAASGTGLEEYMDKTRSLAAETANLLGGLETGEGDRLLVALLFRGEGERITDLYYPPQPFSSSVAVPGPSGNDLLSDFTIEATARGLVYLSLANEIHLDPQALWLREGAAWYLQDLVPYQAGIWGARTFWDLFDRHYDAYREARSNSPASLAQCGALAPDDANAAALLECGGAAACACMDSDLNALQPFAGDLAAFLRNLSGLDGQNELDNNAIRTALESMTGKSWSNFSRDYIDGNVEIPASSFSSLNIARTEDTSQPLETPESSTSTAGWITLAIVIIIVFLVPFVLEPYTMRPRKPGFLEKKLAEDEEEEPDSEDSE